MKKIFTSLFLIFIIMVVFLINVKANSIYNIDMDIYIDEYGNADVKEVWETYLYQGTEGYRAFSDLDNKEIINFSVVDDSGITYENINNWNTNASFEAKKFKSGINYTSSGLELCFGISEYGSKTYTLNYTITNFVTEYTDTQGIYFDLLNMDQDIGNVKITIHSDIDFSIDNSKIWGFGYTGKDNFEDGNIVMTTNGKLSSSEYIVLLVRFESNIFNLDNRLDKSFDDIFEEATGDSEDFINNEYSGHRVYSYVMLLINIVLSFIPIAIILKYLNFQKRKSLSNEDIFDGGKDLPKDKNVDYQREIPCNKNLKQAYFICVNYNVCKNFNVDIGIIGAYLLKWIKEEKINIIKSKKKFLSFKDNEYSIDFNKYVSFEDDIEKGLYEIMMSASGDDKILAPKEFNKWCYKYYYKVSLWLSYVESAGRKEYQNRGLISKESKNIKGLFGTTYTVDHLHIKSDVKDEAIKLLGFKKFLLDFGAMREKEFIEVKLWEEYLIFAELLGIADKVEEQFSKIYPKFSEESILNTDIVLSTITHMVRSGYSGYSRGSSTRYSGISSSSGGGGSSFSSGGSSSGGSSGGGFR